MAGAAEALLEEGRVLLAGGQPEEAATAFARASEVDAKCVEAHRSLGEVLMDLGDVLGAKRAFEAGLKADQSDATLHMYLGQISEGRTALMFFEKGLQLMEGETAAKAQETDGNETDNLANMIVQGCCAVAELFMSDLCFEPDAEAKIEHVLNKALRFGPEHPQVLQTMASFKLSQGKPSEAKASILKAASLVDKYMVRIENENEVDEMELDDDGKQCGANDDKESIIPFGFRANTCRILIEVGEYARVIPILDRLILEDDEVLEIWLLLTQCHVETKDLDAAKTCVTRAKQVCNKFLEAEPSLKTDEDFLKMFVKVDTAVKRVDTLRESGTSS